MTLQELFVDIKYRRDSTGAREAQRDVDKIDKETQELNKSLELTNKLLNRLTVGAVAMATGATVAYSKWTGVVTELAGKAGLANREFRKLYAAESGFISRMTGGDRRLAAEAMQRAHSLGANPRQARHLARMGSILQAGNQAHAPTAVEAAMSLQRGGFGDAGNLLQQVYAAAQSGAGNVEDYFAAARRASGIASAAGVGANDLLSMLTIGSQGGSMSEATTRTMALMRAIARPAMGKAGKFFQERTGEDWEVLTRMQREEGTLAAVEFIGKHFKDSELFKLFSEVEAVNLVKPLLADMEQARANRDIIDRAPEDDAIGKFGKDMGKEFFNSMNRLTNTLKDFLIAWGKPFGEILRHIFNFITRALDALIRLNEFMGGLLAWIPTLLTTLLLVRKGMQYLRKLGGWISTLAAASQAADRLPGGKDGDGKKDTKQADLRDAARGFGAGFGGGLAGGLVATQMGKMWGWVKNLFGDTRKLFGIMSRDAKAGQPWGKLSKDFGKYGGVNFGGGAAARHIGILLVRMGLLIATLSPIGKALGILVAASVFWSKLRSDDSFRPGERFRGAQLDYFGQGGVRGGEPAPTKRDISRHNRMVAEAEADALWGELKGRVGDFFNGISVYIRAEAPSWIVAAWDSLTGTIGWVFGLVDAIFTRVGEFIRDFWDSPTDAIGMLWDDYGTLSAKGASGLMKLILGDVPKELQELERNTENLEPGRAVFPKTMGIPKELLDEMGFEGGFPHLQNVPTTNLPIPDPSKIVMPGTPSTAQITAPITIGDIVINMPRDTEASDARLIGLNFKAEIQKELKHTADRIIQEMDWASP